MQNLWADFADEAVPTERAGRGGGARQRRLNEQAVLTMLRSWLLQEYMLTYGASLGATRIFRRCYWIDGLGKMRSALQEPLPPASNETETALSGRARRKGSPPASDLPQALQAVAAMARQLTQLERPIALYGFVLDSKSGKRQTAGRPLPQIQNLDAAMLTRKEGGVLPANWSEIAPALLPTLEQSAAVFLLNPFKDEIFRYTDLQPLYQRTAPTEIFLWISHKQIETRLLPGLYTTEGASALTNLLRTDRWKSLLAREDAAEHPAPVIHGLIDLFAESMRPHFLSVQRLAFPVHTGPALIEKATCSLLFATRRQDSLYSLNDAVCLRSRRLLVESQQGVLNEEWFIHQREEQATARQQSLYQQAIALGQAQRIRRWPDLRHQLLLAQFGQSTLQEYDQVILTLLERGMVRCDWRKRGPETAEVSVPASEDLLLWR